MSLLENYKKKESPNKEKIITARLPESVYESFKNLCSGVNLSISEAVLLLIEAELKQVGSSPVPLGSPAFNMPAAAPVADSIPVRKRAENTKKPSGGSKQGLNPYKVNEKIPCPVCEKWIGYKNFPRCWKKHDGGYASGIDFLTAPQYAEKVLQMVAEKKKEAGL